MGSIYTIIGSKQYILWGLIEKLISNTGQNAGFGKRDTDIEVWLGNSPNHFLAAIFDNKILQLLGKILSPCILIVWMMSSPSRIIKLEISPANFWLQQIYWF